MKLAQIAKKPQLALMSLDDEETVKEFGEPLEFYTWDRQPMDIFLKLSTVDPTNQGAIISAVKELVMDEKGNKILEGEDVLPTNVMLRVMTKVVEGLGK
jgi:hypothetical protein